MKNFDPFPQNGGKTGVDPRLRSFWVLMTSYKRVLSKTLLCQKRKCNGGYNTSTRREGLQKKVKARSFVFDLYRYNFQASSQ